MNLIVACPSCKTVFRMVREQLDASDGRVRCGHCMEVFNAEEQLARTDTAPIPEEVSQYETLAPENLSFVQAAKKEQFWANPKLRMPLIALCGLMVIVLAVQILRSNQERLAIFSPSLASIAQTLCQARPCAHKPMRQISHWRIESSSFQKENANAFRLTATIKNTTEAHLLMPHLELQLLDSREALLVRKILTIDAPQTSASTASFEKTYHWLISPSPSDSAKFGIDHMVGYRLVLFYP